MTNHLRKERQTFASVWYSIGFIWDEHIADGLVIFLNKTKGING